MQQTIPANEKQKIIKALEDKQALLPCPRCHKQKFTLLDGYFNQPIQQNLQNFNLAGPSLPSAVIVCENLIPEAACFRCFRPYPKEK